MLSKQTVALNFCLCILSCSVFAGCLKERRVEYLTETCMLVGKELFDVRVNFCSLSSKCYQLPFLVGFSKVKACLQ